MKKAPATKVTLKYYPNECLGKPYEVTKIINGITVEYPDGRGGVITVRLADRLSEKEANLLITDYEVTTI